MCGVVSISEAQRAKSLMSERSGLALLGLQLFGLHQPARRLHQRNLRAPRMVVHQLQGSVAEAALGRVEDALEGEVVGGLRDAAQIGQRIADFRALVEARAADHAIGQAKRDEALFELAHLERGAHENGDVVKRDCRRGAAIARCPRR